MRQKESPSQGRRDQIVLAACHSDAPPPPLTRMQKPDLSAAFRKGALGPRPLKSAADLP